MNRAVAAAVAALVLVPPAFAQSAQQRRNKREVQQDKREVKRDVAEYVDDRIDFARARAYESRLAAARAATDWNAVATLDVEVSRFLAGERQEANREVAQAAGEAARSAGEARAAGAEARGDALRGRGPGVRADSRRDARDDRRDARDDARDLHREQQGRALLARLHSDWRLVQGRFDPQALDTRAAVLATVMREQAREVNRDAAEHREDRRELHEDRREQREDRRQRK